MRAIAYYASAITLFAFQDAMTKWVAALYPVTQVMFLRSIFSLVPLALLIWALGGIGTIRFARLPLHMARSAVLLASIVLWFFALKLLPLATAMTIGYAGALFMTALSVPMLGEKVGPLRWAALLVGFAGVIIVIRPGLGMLEWAMALPLLTAASYALYQLLTRRVALHDAAVASLFYVSLVGFLMASLVAPFHWVAIEPWLVGM